MASIADVYVTLLPEAGKIADGLKRALRAADDDVIAAAKRWRKDIERELSDAKIKVTADTTQAKRDIDKATQDQSAEIKVDADTAKAEAKIDAAARDRDTKIKVSVDTNSVTAAAGKITSALGDIAGKVGGGLKLFGGLEALVIAPNVVPLLGEMVSAVGQLSGVLGLLPGVAGTAALAIGSLKIATSGFDDALKSMDDPKKFAAALTQLAPSAQDAARAIQGLMPEVRSLKATVQGAFFEGFGTQINALGTTYLPMFRTTMSQFAAIANRALTEVSTMLQTPEMQGQIQSILNNLSSGFNVLGDALKPVVSAFADIMEVSSSFMPQLAGVIKDAAFGFANFISEAKESGKIADWIQGGIEAFTNLKDIVVNVWTGLSGFFQAAAGPEGAGGLLTRLVEITGKFTEWSNSVQGQTAIRDFFNDARDALANLWPTLQKLPGAFLDFFNAAKTATDAVLPVLQGIYNILDSIPGGIETVVYAFLAWKTITGITSVLTSLGKISSLLGKDIPASAKTGGSGIAAAFGKGGAAFLAITAFIPLIDEMNQKIKDSKFENPYYGGKDGNLTPTQWERQGFGTSQEEGKRRHDWIEQFLGQSLGPDELLMNVMDDPNAWQRVGAFSAPWGVAGKPAEREIPGNLGGGNGPHGGGYSSPVLTQDNSDNLVPTPPTLEGAPVPVPGGGTGGGGIGGPVAPSGFNWEAVMPHEGGTWSNADTGNNGHYGGLQFSPETWAAYGGLEFASRADYASPDEQKTVADRTAFYGYNGLAPQGLGAWEAITKGNVPGITTSTQPPRPTPQYGSALMPGRSGSSGGGNSYVPSDDRLVPNAARANDMIAQAFPFLKDIGGYRANGMGSNDHPSGHALDIMIPDWQTAAGKNKGDAINKWLQENAAALGIESTIWQDFWKPVGGEGHRLNRMDQGPDAAHLTHVHAKFLDQLASGTPMAPGGGYEGPGQSASNPMYTKNTEKSDGEKLANDLVGGFAEIFGFGDLWKNPLDFGLFKIFKNVMGLKPADDGTTGVGAGSGSSGNPLMDLAAQFIPGLKGTSPKPYGDVTVGGSGEGGAPFIPGVSSGGGNLLDFVTQFIPGAGENKGDTNTDNSFNPVFHGGTAADNAPVMDALDSYFVQNQRRNLP